MLPIGRPLTRLAFAALLLGGCKKAPAPSPRPPEPAQHGTTEAARLPVADRCALISAILTERFSATATESLRDSETGKRARQPDGRMAVAATWTQPDGREAPLFDAPDACGSGMNLLVPGAEAVPAPNHQAIRVQLTMAAGGTFAFRAGSPSPTLSGRVGKDAHGQWHSVESAH